MTPRAKHDALTEAIVELVDADAAAFSHIYTRSLIDKINATNSRVDYARAIAQRLVRNLERGRVTLAAIPGSGGREGRGRVTDRRLDQRLRREPTDAG